MTRSFRVLSFLCAALLLGTVTALNLRPKTVQALPSTAIATTPVANPCTQETTATAVASDYAASVVMKDASGKEVEIKDTSRIVTLGGPVTEIVFALCAEKQIIGVDTSSLYPVLGVKHLPKVGYQRQLAAEGILALKPTLVLGTTQAGPATTLEQLRNAGLTVLMLPAEDSIAGAKAKITGIAHALRKDKAGADLIAALDANLAKAETLLKRVTHKPKVMFIYARGAGTVQVAGTKTAAHEMILLAGGENAVTGYEGYKPLTAEATVTAAPDVLLVLSLGLESVGGNEGLLKLSGLDQTPAGQNKRIVAMDDLYLLGFGPRTGQAVLDLVALLHPELGE
jgi:iron complex transport system substrate-binding protein